VEPARRFAEQLAFLSGRLGDARTAAPAGWRDWAAGRAPGAGVRLHARKVVPYLLVEVDPGEAPGPYEPSPLRFAGPAAFRRATMSSKHTRHLSMTRSWVARRHAAGHR